jgi:hypothetical protein
MDYVDIGFSAKIVDWGRILFEDLYVGSRLMGCRIEHVAD